MSQLSKHAGTSMSDIAALHQELSGIYKGRGQARYGLESISQLQHALQAAALAESQVEPSAIVLAALLHDIGHLIHAHGENPAAEGKDDRHELIGAKWLSARLPRDVTEPVRLHVAAKRYLCTTDPEYAARLAPDSVLSLKLQGGPMTSHEADAFRFEAFADDAIRLRRLDEAAKESNAVTPPIEHFLRHLASVRIRS
jgi:phosphonate degradation associated HDIG domain protein